MDKLNSLRTQLSKEEMLQISGGAKPPVTIIMDTYDGKSVPCPSGGAFGECICTPQYTDYEVWSVNIFGKLKEKIDSGTKSDGTRVDC